MENDKLIVRQPYAVTLAKHRLNVHEMRIMFRIIQALQKEMGYDKDRIQVQKTLFGDKIIRIPTKVLLPEGSKNYANVRLALEALKNRNIKIKGEDPKHGKYDLYTGLILRGKYFHNNEFVEVEVDKDLLPSFLALAKNYSQYLLEVAFNSSSPNVMKLYQFLSHWKDKATKKVMIEELRDWLQLGSKYKRSKDLRERILEPAAKELKEKADVFFKICSPIKRGRQIIGWNLNIYRKITEKEKNKAAAFGANIRIFLKEHFKLRDKDITQLESFISKPELHRHIWDAMHRVAKRIDDNKNKEPIKNRRAYMMATLKKEIEQINIL